MEHFEHRMRKRAIKKEIKEVDELDTKLFEKKNKDSHDK